MTQLYRVTKEWYVMAETEMQAELMDTFLCEPDVTVQKATRVDSDWLDVVPPGSSDNKTCLEILQAKEKNEHQ